MVRAVRSSIAEPAARTGWAAAGDFLAFFVGRAADMVDDDDDSRMSYYLSLANTS